MYAFYRFTHFCKTEPRLTAELKKDTKTEFFGENGYEKENIKTGFGKRIRYMMFFKTLDKTSLFEWISFGTQSAQLAGNFETVKCTLQVCKKDSTTCNTKTQCPASNGYAYTLTGQ